MNQIKFYFYIFLNTIITLIMLPLYATMYLIGKPIKMIKIGIEPKDIGNIIIDDFKYKQNIIKNYIKNKLNRK